MTTENLDTLLNMTLFSGIGSEGLSSFLTCLDPRVRNFGKNETVALEGEPFGGIGCVLSGEVSVARENASGDRVVMAVLGPGSLFGEMAAWADFHVWPATVQATEPSAVMFIPPDKISDPCAKACRWHSIIIGNMLRILAEKALALNRKVEYLAMKTMRGKLATYFLERVKLAKSATFTLPMNRNAMADYLGVSRPSMSREMGNMRDEGVIDFHMATVKIRDMEKLKLSSDH